MRLSRQSSLKWMSLANSFPLVRLMIRSLQLLFSVIITFAVFVSSASAIQVETPTEQVAPAETDSPKAEETKPDKPKRKGKAKPKGKPIWSLEPDPNLPNVLILGDSISIGYTLGVRKSLAEKANVFRPCSADGRKPQNCQGTTTGVKKIEKWLSGQKWDVIHFNWGLHDLKKVKGVGSLQNSDDPNDPYQATVEQYSDNLRAIVEKLQATEATLIFATTTPIVADSAGPHRAVEDPARYNAAAIAIMEENGIEVNDLYAVCDGKLEQLQRPKNVHFRHEGSVLLGQKVTAAIEAKLPAESE